MLEPRQQEFLKELRQVFGGFHKNTLQAVFCD